ncbi:Fc.00g071900.m01.CDS01 [Cosmosporella sp. VM-42]
MRSSTYLEATSEGAHDDFDGLNEVWMGAFDGEPVSFPGIDASLYAASPTPLHSPETPNLDQVAFPSQMDSGFGQLDPLFGDYAPTLGQLTIPLSNQVPASLSEAYDLNSAAPSPYPSSNVWPSHVSPTAFLPTPPMAVDQYSEEDSEDEKPKRKATRSRPKRTQTQLRTASRAPKKRTANTVHKPAENVEEVQARAAHNQVEQQYRKRLNTHFEKLLEVLPPLEHGGGLGDKRVSKAEVLDLARGRIRELERDMGRLERERRELRGRICGLERRVGGM